MAVDAMIGHGLQLPDLPGRVKEKLRGGLASTATISNPVDLVGSATVKEYRLALEALAAEEVFDALVVICVPTVVHDPTDIYLAAAQAVHGTGKALLGVFMSPDNVRRRAEERKAGLPLFPVYRYPESAAFALHMFDRYRERRDAPAGRVVSFDVDRARAEQIIRQAQGEGRQVLTFLEARELCAAYGIPVARSVLAATADQAVRAAEELGGPVALKLEAQGLAHKSDIGGVAVGIHGEAEVRKAFDSMLSTARKARPDLRIDGIVVQEMVRGGRETIIGTSHDAAFGPLLMFGLGGIYVEVLKDVAFRIVPVTDV
jgi:acetyltransferase